MVPGLRIVATGSYCCEVAGDPPPLKSLARETTGVPVRRVGRFVQLALIGAGRCVNGRTLPADTATYFTSGRGDLETTLQVLEQMCVEHRPPAPFDFINTVGNSACFHVAKCFGLSGRSQFVTSRLAPLEAALRLAALDMAHANVKTALVGSADMCTAPLASHRARIGVSGDTPVGEGSHWFLLGADEGSRAPLGFVRSVRSFPDDVELLRHLRGLRIDPDGAVLARGQHLPAARWEGFRETTGMGDAFAYGQDLPWYDSQTGYGIHLFLTASVARTMVHIDGDPSGRSTLLVIEKPPAGATAPTPALPDRRTGG
jgi:hypothetical protein